MYCKTCGKELNENAVICVGCGCVVDQEKVNKIVGKKYNEEEVSFSTNEKIKHVHILGFILSICSTLFLLTVPIMGEYLIGAYVMFMILLYTGAGLSIYGIIKGKKEPTKIYAILGIVIAFCSFFCCGVTFGLGLSDDLISYLFRIF